MRVLVVTLLSLFLALTGVRAAIADPGPMDLVCALGLGCALALSCSADARQRGRPLPSAGGFAILFAWPIAVPLYFLFSRDPKRGAVLAIVVAVAGGLLYFGAYCTASYLVWGEVV